MHSQPTHHDHESFGPKETAELLEKHYSSLRQESLLQIQSIKNHVKNSQLLISAIISVTVFLGGSPNYNLREDTAWLWVIFMLVATTLTYYLLYAIIEAIFGMHSLGEYLACLERRINEIAGKKIMFWEELCEEMWSGPARLKGVVHTLWVMNLYSGLAIFAISVVLPFYIYYRLWAWWHDGLSRSMLILFGLYSLGSFALGVWVVLAT
jgi:hypothetical protein